MKFFKKTQSETRSIENIDNGPYSLIDEYNGIKSDIAYMENKYDVFILKSLESDFEFVKNKLYKNDNGKYWSNTDEFLSDSSEMRLVKKSTEKYGRELKLVFKHNNNLNRNFEVTSVSLTVSGSSIMLSNKMLKNILFKYIMSYSISKTKLSLDSVKKSFKALKEIIGEDVHRDIKIDEILK